MTTDYLLGKDLAHVQQSLKRVEDRLSSLEAMIASGRSTSDGVFDPSGIAIPVAVRGATIPTDASPEAVTASIAWSATDVYNLRRVPTPDRAAELVFFGFILDVQAYEFQKITDTILPVVTQLWRDDVSAAPDYGNYRPTGYRGAYCCVMGFYSQGLNSWNWIAVAFQHSQDNPNARFSRTYDMRGDFVTGTAKHGWDPDVILAVPADLKYKCNARYADADTENGVHFYFHSLRT